MYIFCALTCHAFFYPLRLFWCELQSFGDVGLLLNVIRFGLWGLFTQDNPQTLQYVGIIGKTYLLLDEYMSVPSQQPLGHECLSQRHMRLKVSVGLAFMWLPYIECSIAVSSFVQEPLLSVSPRRRKCTSTHG